jgi:hypothetical protein
VAIEAIEVGVDDQWCAVGPLDADELLVGVHAERWHDTELAPHLMEGADGAGAPEVVSRAVEGIAMAPPGRAEAARRGVHLQDGCPITIHAGVAPGGQAADTGADD